VARLSRVNPAYESEAASAASIQFRVSASPAETPSMKVPLTWGTAFGAVAGVGGGGTGDGVGEGADGGGGVGVGDGSGVGAGAGAGVGGAGSGAGGGAAQPTVSVNSTMRKMTSPFIFALRIN